MKITGYQRLKCHVCSQWLHGHTHLSIEIEQLIKNKTLGETILLEESCFVQNISAENIVKLYYVKL